MLPIQFAPPLQTLGFLHALRSQGSPVVPLPGASTRCWLANDAHTEQLVLLQDRLFAKNNMRHWRQAAPSLAPEGARALGLSHQTERPHFPDSLAQAAGMAVRALTRTTRQTTGRVRHPMRAMQSLLTQLLPSTLFGTPIRGNADDVMEATDLLEQVHGRHQLHAFFGRLCGDDAGPGVHSEDDELEARLTLHHAFRQSYFDAAQADVRSHLDAFVAIYRAAVASPAAALTWLCHVLAAYPERQHQLREQLSAPPSVSAGRVHLRALLLETLRYFPPAWLLVRVATENTVLSGQAVAAGDHILVSPWLRHRDPTLWKAPESFDLDRFSAGSPGQHNQLMPFGLGARKCPATHFSMQLLNCVAEQLILHFDICPESDQLGAVLWVNLRPEANSGPRLVPRPESVT